MIKNKVKKGMILIYTDEYGNQKAINPRDLTIKFENGFETQLGMWIEGTINKDDEQDKAIKDSKELIKQLTDSIELLHAQLVLDNLEIENLKNKIGGNK